MRTIQMVDLVSQYSEIKEEVLEATGKIMAEASFINGSAVKQFVQNLSAYYDGAYVIPCANGTDALQIAMMALDLKPGDEIIVPVFTYVATAEVIALLGLTPVFVDVDPNTFNIDSKSVEAALTERTRAIVPVHLFGQCADMEPLINLASKHDLYIIEDTAQAISSRYRFSNGRKALAGTMGTIGTTSFFPSKNLGCFGDGGAIFTCNADLAEKMRKIANHGQTNLYYHDLVGVNSRLDTLQAAILDIKLKHLDRYNSSRQKAAERYDSALAGISWLEIPYRATNSTHVFHQYTLKLQKGIREKLIAYLEENGVPSKVYYPLPLHKQGAYSVANQSNSSFPVAEDLCEQVLSLPMHSELTEEQIDYIAHLLQKYSL
jgi:UDP-2-acetamido-2-deoxy-ribo-hexuluronate aminotransferase